MRSSKKAIMASLCSGLVALILLAIVFAGVRHGTQAAQPGGSVKTSTSAISTSDQARAAQTQLDAPTFADARDLLKRIADTPEPSIFSAEKTADDIGNNPAALFAYVRNHVRVQIYSGVLRGARGTLIGGAGNSWDQALLLATMLRHEGREVRFARVHLTPEMAVKIVDRMFTDAARPQLPAGKPLQIPDSLQNASRAVLAKIETDRQAAQGDLLQALDRANFSLGDAAVSEQQLDAEAADHLFVEYRDGDRWIALDPVAQDAPGATVSSVTEFAPEIPESFYHHVTIRVSIEERRDQALQQRDVLRFPTTAAALSGAQVSLWHRLDHDAIGEWRATPVLQIDGQAYAARTFGASGLIAATANSKEDAINQAQQAISQVGAAAAAFGGGNKKASTTTAATPQGGFTAESLEVEFSDPAQHSEIVRRELIDRIGPVARANKISGNTSLPTVTFANGLPIQLEGVYALTFATGPLDPALLAHRISSAAGVIDDLQSLREAPPTQNGSLSPEDREHLARVVAKFPVLLQALTDGLVTLSQHFALRLRVGDSPALFYESTPRFVIASFDLTSGLALDLRFNTVRVLARKSSAFDLVRANLARSVGDAAIEADVLMPKAQERRIASVDIFNRARTEGIRLVTLRGGAPLTGVQTSDVARARMAIVKGGNLLIAPERTPSDSSSHFAWWNLDPSTGDATSTLDTGLNGFQNLLEDAAITQEIDSMAYAETLPEGWEATVPGVWPEVEMSLEDALREAASILSGGLR